MFRRMLACFVCTLFFATQVLAFGPRGHAAVGAIADQKLAGTATGAKVSTMLNGMSLEKAALVADDIKSCDTHPNTFVISGQPALTQQMREFLIANPSTASHFNHHAYHYVDIPVEGTSEYMSGTTGRSDVDVVKTMEFCVKVLKGIESDNNARKITKPVALILLSHYVGDMHQPLHVGTEYFDNAGHPVNPDVTGTTANSDKGGNGLTTHLLNSSGDLQIMGSLHSYWDSKAVTGAFDLLQAEIIAAAIPGGASDGQVAKYLATQTPTGWVAVTTPAEGWSLAWANEMMPQARQAHQKFNFSSMSINTTKHTAAGQAIEKPVASGADTYTQFAAKATRDNIHKAGWRLAALLEQAIP
ncbi:MAG: S1/P1 nuclease [Gemmatales bacterium]